MAVVADATSDHQQLEIAFALTSWMNRNPGPELREQKHTNKERKKMNFESGKIWAIKPGGIFCPRCGRRGSLFYIDWVKCNFAPCGYFGDLHWNVVENTPPLNIIRTRLIDNECPTEILLNRLATHPPFKRHHDHIGWAMRNDAAEMVDSGGPLRGYPS